VYNLTGAEAVKWKCIQRYSPYTGHSAAEYFH